MATRPGCEMMTIKTTSDAVWVDIFLGMEDEREETEVNKAEAR
jgi:hypothetical protein